MIVNYTSAGWEIITQRAHALLAAQLGYHWKTTFHARWLETLLAIAGHDDGEFEFTSDDLLTPAGGPLDYSMKCFDAGHCQRQAIYSQARSQFITLLNSMHLVFLYRKEGKTDKAARAFLQQQQKLQSRLRKTLHTTRQEAERIYSLMQWCDALSLMICQHAIQPEHRMSEISKGPDKISYRLAEVEHNVLTVRPWPFTEPRFSVFVESRVVPILKFDNAAQFRQALYSVKVKENRYEFIKKTSPGGRL